MEEEVYALRNSEEYDFQTLLGYARNELYARHGFAFNEISNTIHFICSMSGIEIWSIV